MDPSQRRLEVGAFLAVVSLGELTSHAAVYRQSETRGLGRFGHFGSHAIQTNGRERPLDMPRQPPLHRRDLQDE